MAISFLRPVHLRAGGGKCCFGPLGLAMTCRTVPLRLWVSSSGRIFRIAPAFGSHPPRTRCAGTHAYSFPSTPMAAIMPHSSGSVKQATKRPGPNQETSPRCAFAPSSGVSATSESPKAAHRYGMDGDQARLAVRHRCSKCNEIKGICNVIVTHSSLHGLVNRAIITPGSGLALVGDILPIPPKSESARPDAL